MPHILAHTPPEWYHACLRGYAAAASLCCARSARTPGLSVEAEGVAGAMYLLLKVDPCAFADLPDDVAFAGALQREQVRSRAPRDTPLVPSRALRDTPRVPSRALRDTPRVPSADRTLLFPAAAYRLRSCLRPHHFPVALVANYICSLYILDHPCAHLLHLFASFADPQALVLLPGTAFGAPGRVRLVLCAPLAALEEAWDRLDAFCAAHHRSC